ncbi:MAG: hypothetical protein WCD18_05400 [Thermosynechococcaceae cyanobacterium]
MIWEVTRILSVSLSGAVLMFLVQPWLYRSAIGFFLVTDLDIEDWLAEQYTPGAAIVFGTALVATILWYLMALNKPATSSSEVAPMRLPWGLLLLIPIIGICCALYFFNKSNDALLSLTFLYVVDILVLYWFATAISSPGLLKFIPPGSFTLRHWMRMQ